MNLFTFFFFFNSHDQVFCVKGVFSGLHDERCLSIRAGPFASIGIVHLVLSKLSLLHIISFCFFLTSVLNFTDWTGSSIDFCGDHTLKKRVLPIRRT